jgi:hypothetical protein
MFSRQASPYRGRVKDFITPDKWLLPILWFLAGAQLARTASDAVKTKTYLGFESEFLANTIGIILGIGSLWWFLTAAVALYYAIRTIRT